MTSRFILTVVCISLFATSTFAQMTGTLITRNPAQTDIMEKGAARKMSRGFTRCVAERSVNRVKVYLDLPVGSKEAISMAPRLTDREGDECMGMGELMMPDAGPVIVMVTSAAGASVVVAVAELFVRIGSGVSLATVATARRAAMSAGAVRLMAYDCEAPTARVERIGKVTKPFTLL